MKREDLPMLKEFLDKTFVNMDDDGWLLLNKENKILGKIELNSNSIKIYPAELPALGRHFNLLEVSSYWLTTKLSQLKSVLAYIKSDYDSADSDQLNDPEFLDMKENEVIESVLNLIETTFYRRDVNGLNSRTIFN